MEPIEVPAVIIIDMLNEYLDPNGKIFCEKCREIIPKVRDLIGLAHKNDFPVVYLNTSLTSENEPIVKKWGFHAVRGTWGSEVIPELAPKRGDVVVKKRGYDGFFESELESKLRNLKVTQLVISGIHTHVCVLLTGVGAFQRGFNVITLEDCIATGSTFSHESRLRFFKSHIGELMKLDDFKKLHTEAKDT